MGANDPAGAIDSKLDCYAILGVPVNAQDVEIHAAFNALAERYQPEGFTGPREEAVRKMADLTTAYEVLADPVRRRRYDFRRKIDAKTAPFYDKDPSHPRPHLSIVNPSPTTTAPPYKSRGPMYMLVGIVVILIGAALFPYSGPLKNWLNSRPFAPAVSDPKAGADGRQPASPAKGAVGTAPLSVEKGATAGGTATKAFTSSPPPTDADKAAISKAAPTAPAPTSSSSVEKATPLPITKGAPGAPSTATTDKAAPLAAPKAAGTVENTRSATEPPQAAAAQPAPPSAESRNAAPNATARGQRARSATTSSDVGNTGQVSPIPTPDSAPPPPGATKSPNTNRSGASRPSSTEPCSDAVIVLGLCKNNPPSREK